MPSCGDDTKKSPPARNAEADPGEISARERAEQTLADYADRLQRLSRRLLQTQEEERRRIARELHDEVGQSLTAVLIKLHSIAQHPATPDLTEEIRILNEVLQQVRSLSLDLHPALLEDLGLEAALRWYLDRRVQQAGIVGQVDLQLGKRRLAPELEMGCFRIIQESITNVIRHARATTVRVAIQRLGTELSVVVDDDGVGFDVAATLRPSETRASLGLVGMQERVALLGGHLRICSTLGVGTTVTARMPLSSPAVARPDPEGNA